MFLWPAFSLTFVFASCLRTKGKGTARIFIWERIDLQGLTFWGFVASKVSLVVKTWNDKLHFRCLESVRFNLMPAKVKVVLTVRDFTGCQLKLDWGILLFGRHLLHSLVSNSENFMVHHFKFSHLFRIFLCHFPHLNQKHLSLTGFKKGLPNKVKVRENKIWIIFFERKGEITSLPR